MKFKRSLVRQLGYTPGGRRDPWREFWRKGLGIYVEIIKSTNRSGTEIGVSIAWTPEEMLPEGRGWSVYGWKRERLMKEFLAMQADYDKVSNDIPRTDA